MLISKLSYDMPQPNKTPEAPLGFLGATWLLEAVSLLPRTALETPGVRELLGPRYAFPGLIEPLVRDIHEE